MKRIYLDNNATTPIDPRVAKVIGEELHRFGNPSSVHSFGREARSRLNGARELIADYLSAKPNEILFTSSGTEGINMLIRGFLKDKPGHLITSNVEHSAVFNTISEIEKGGQHKATYLSPGLWGAVKPDAVKEAIRPDTKLIVLMTVNNETGVVTEIEAIAKIAQEAGIPLIVDGVAWLGKEKIKMVEGISAIAFSGHKIHAPPGIGFIYLRSGQKLPPLLTGGDQEFGKRSGTENLPGILGLAEAIRILKEECVESVERMRFLREKLENGLFLKVPGMAINGEGPRICNTVNVAFKGYDGESLLMMLDRKGIAASHGSACSSGALELSRILLNMGISAKAAKTSLRFSLSRFTTEDEIQQVLNQF